MHVTRSSQARRELASSLSVVSLLSLLLLFVLIVTVSVVVIVSWLLLLHKQVMAMLRYGFCRVPSTLRPLLSNASAPKDELYSEEQMRGVLSAYAAANALELGDGSIKLDKLMISNLFNKKEPQMEGDSCPVEEVVRRLLGKLQLFHKVTRVTEQVRHSEVCSAEAVMSSCIHRCRQCTLAA